MKYAPKVVMQLVINYQDGSGSRYNIISFTGTSKKLYYASVINDIVQPTTEVDLVEVMNYHVFSDLLMEE